MWRKPTSLGGSFPEPLVSAASTSSAVATTNRTPPGTSGDDGIEALVVGRVGHRHDRRPVARTESDGTITPRSPLREYVDHLLVEIVLPEIDKLEPLLLGDDDREVALRNELLLDKEVAEAPPTRARSPEPRRARSERPDPPAREARREGGPFRGLPAGAIDSWKELPRASSTRPHDRRIPPSGYALARGDNAVQRLGAGRPLGGAHLRALVDPGPRDRARRMDTVLRKLAHTAEYAILGALLFRAVRNAPAAVLLFASAYAATDEVHQTFVSGRHGSPVDWRSTRPARSSASQSQPASHNDARGGNRPGWRPRRHSPAVGCVSRRRRASLRIHFAARYRRPHGGSRRERPPSSTRGRRAASGTGVAALGRFAEDRAPVFLRPDGDATSALRELAAAGARMGVFTDAPEPLARVALAQLGATRRIEFLEAGADARERVLEQLGPAATVASSRDDLVRISRDA